MYELRSLPPFKDFIRKLDNKTSARLLKRLLRVRLGNFGDSESVGDGVFELREHFGPGYRIYCVKQGENVIFILGGGNKSNQKSDIKEAKELAKSMK